MGVHGIAHGTARNMRIRSSKVLDRDSRSLDRGQNTGTRGLHISPLSYVRL